MLVSPRWLCCYIRLQSRIATPSQPRQQPLNLVKVQDTSSSNNRLPSTRCQTERRRIATYLLLRASPRICCKLSRPTTSNCGGVLPATGRRRTQVGK